MRPFALVFAISGLALASTACTATSDADGVGATEDAVVTRRCPTSIAASFDGIRAFSVDEIAANRGGLAFGEGEELEQGPLPRVRALRAFSTNLHLGSAQGAVCTYGAEDGLTTARFYTRAGKNILRIDSDADATDQLSFYVTVAEYSKDSIRLAHPSAGIFYRGPNTEHAFDPFYVGRAWKADVKVGGASAPAMGDAAIRAELEAAVRGVEYMSESDVEFGVLQASILPTEAVDAATVRAKLGTPELVGSREGDFQEWFADELVDDAEDDAHTVRYKAAMRRVHALMTAEMTDLKVVYLAEESLERTMDVGAVNIYLVGRSKNGTLFAVHTVAIWT